MQTWLWYGHGGLSQLINNIFSFSLRRAVVRYTANAREQQICQDNLSGGEEKGAMGRGLHGEKQKRAKYDHVCVGRRHVRVWCAGPSTCTDVLITRARLLETAKYLR